MRQFPLGHLGPVRDVFFRDDGAQVLTVGDDRISRIWNTANGSLRQEIPWSAEVGAWIAVSPDLRTVVTLCSGEKGRHFVVRDGMTGEPRNETNAQTPDVNAAVFSPDGTRFATVGDNQCGRIWDAQSGRPLTPSFKHGGGLTIADWSPDGRRVLTRRFAAPRQGARQVRFSPAYGRGVRPAELSARFKQISTLVSTRVNQAAASGIARTIVACTAPAKA